MIIKMLVLKKL